MCGIIGIISKEPVADRLIESLQRLEYRGYDSAGIATLTGGDLHRRRAEGKLRNLQRVVDADPIDGTIGIGHTRWATHGVANTSNAHPHSDGRVSVVHNGIIENFTELREKLGAKGVEFQTDTDTEVVVHLVSDYLAQGLAPKEAVSACLKELEGAFALAILFKEHPDLIIGARRGSPLVIGYGEGEMYFGSDAMAVSPFTNRVCYLEEGDWGIITLDGAEIFDSQDRPANREIKTNTLSGALVGKGDYRHFMLKEIYEQPSVIAETLHARLNPQDKTLDVPELPVDAKDIDRIIIIACGTAFYAGLVAKYWIETHARIPVECDVASEFRYREPPLGKNTVGIVISQSGETIDTLEAMRHLRKNDVPVLSIVNMPESSIARESDAVIQTLAGPEIGVASTKAFTTQLTALASLTIALAEARGTISREDAQRLIMSLVEIPARSQEVLNVDADIAALAHDVAEARDVLYLGRHLLFPIAMEGALKLKEISYIHAEGYAAGEMKHGPIALIDENVPVVVCAPSGDQLIFEKTISNVEEVMARGGKVVLFSDAAGCARMAGKVTHCITLPDIHPFVTPILYAFPMQMLAYHVAVAKGTDVDQPRNLAKSVTVE